MSNNNNTFLDISKIAIMWLTLWGAIAIWRTGGDLK